MENELKPFTFGDFSFIINDANRLPNSAVTLLRFQKQVRRREKWSVYLGISRSFFKYVWCYSNSSASV